MNAPAFLLALVAIAVLLVEAVISRGRPWVALGLALAVTAWVVQSVHPVADVLMR